MNKAGRILIEVLLAAIFLLVAVPIVPTISERAAGFDRRVWAFELEWNKQRIKDNDQIERLRREVAALDAQNHR